MGRLTKIATTAFVLMAAFVTFAAHAAERGPRIESVQSTTAQDTPNQVKLLLDLLADPAVQHWIEERRAETVSTPTASAARPMTPHHFLSLQLDHARESFEALGAALPKLPADIERATTILSLEFRERGLIEIALLVVGFVVLGFGAEWLFWQATTGLRAWISNLELKTVADRLRAMMIRLAFGMGIIAVFAFGSIGVFLLRHWPPLLKEIVLGYLFAFLVLRCALLMGRFLFAPAGTRFHNVERFRIVPMSANAAQFWHKRIAVLAGWVAFSLVTLSLLGVVGFSAESLRIVEYAIGLGVLIGAIEIVWRRPHDEAESTRHHRHLGHGAGAWLLSLYFIVLWVLFVAHVLAMFWLAFLVIAVPVAIDVVERTAQHLLRPPEAQASERPSTAAVFLERGLKAALIIGAALVLAHAWHINLVELTARDTMMTRLLRGALNAVVILLIADVAWHVMKALFDRKLAAAEAAGQPDSEDARRGARLRTLLPILRNILFAVFAVMVVLMVLSAIGFEIGPLIAGAGVVGVAIGFGAQTLVKDIISGVFYLLDDAFRVGEYIQSGSHKGTVESFSLRSIKLRHHRGPLTTVPFGELGAVQNLSRDWVIDKLTIGVTYDSDLDKAKKLVKQIGKELAEDPEFAPHIIETLKMQGVEQFGDFAVELRLKMTTKPGEQFPIRRRAYSLIKKAFDANGIKFAYPTVQVAGGSDELGAVARQGLDLIERAKQAP